MARWTDEKALKTILVLQWTIKRWFLDETHSCYMKNCGGKKGFVQGVKVTRAFDSL